jgi:pimeloyl-ACP methyl ester carboxylesterase
MAFHPDHAQALGPAYLEFVLAAGADQLIRQNRAVIARPDARPHLPRLRCPVLVLCGEADRLTPPAAVAKARAETEAAYRAAGRPDALEVYIEPGVAHQETPPMREKVLAFFRDCL